MLNLTQAVLRRTTARSVYTSHTVLAVKKQKKTTKRIKAPQQQHSIESFRASNNLLSILEDPEFPKEVEEDIIHRMVEYKRILKDVPAGPLRAVALHEGIDQAFIEEAQDLESADRQPEPVTCKKGCNHCCHRLIRVTSDEAQLLANCLLKREGGTVSEKTMETLKRQATYSAERELEFWLLPKAQSKCIFLDDQGECSVYESRPVDCRIMRVVSEPELCSKEATKRGEKIARPISLLTEVLYSAATTLDGQYPVPLPVALLRTLSSPSVATTEEEQKEQMKRDFEQFENNRKYDPASARQ